MSTDVEWREVLTKLIRRPSAEQRLVERARLVLLVTFEGLSISRVAVMCDVSRATVRKWVDRFQAKPGLRSLNDARRTGRPRRRTERDDAVLISLACQEPRDHERLDARMTQALVAELAEAQGTKVSRSTVQRVLASAEVRPHLERYYLFTEKDRPNYRERRDAICDIYMADLPPDEVIVCFDEKSNIQALGTPHPGRGTKPGKVRLKEHNYIRYGTRNLVAAVNPKSGEVVTAEMFPSRGFASEEAVEMLRSVAMRLPDAKTIHLVWDNGSTHVSRLMQSFLASAEGQRFKVYFTPAHASWLNLAENFFSRFSRRYLAGRRYDGLEDLDDHVYASLNDYNARHATPMAWTYNPKLAA